MSRVNAHIVASLGQSLVSNFRRDGLQSFLDEKCASGLSFSIVDHLRWDLNQIFEMAVEEDVIGKNPARLLFTPSEAKQPERQVMTLEEVKQCLAVLDPRERLIVQLAVITGMRPGEILGLPWKHIKQNCIDVRQRVYRGDIDRPKTAQSIRSAAISEGLAASLEQWRLLCIDTSPDAWVFSSERRTPLLETTCYGGAFSPA